MDDSVGYFVLMALLGVAAAYNLANRGKPRPALTSLKKKIAIWCFGVAFACFAGLVAVALISSQNSVPQ
jgi:hypothetical protein